jgi:hypothetical protein
MGDSGILDEAYERLHHTGPEFKGWLSNHGPMAVDALLRMGQGHQVRSWISQYESRLEGPPEARWEIAEEQWREFLGDASRLGDWCALFAELVHTEPLESLLARWWPRLLPGAIASATHGLIRTGHAVRALREQVTAPRLNELAQALGYWAARWQPIPGQQRPDGFRQVGPALDALPSINIDGGARTRIAQLAQIPSWPAALRALQRPTESAQVPVALDVLVDAAVTRYEIWGHSNPIMLVHAATAPRAAALVLPALPQELWLDTYDTAWAVAAAISSAYRSASPKKLHTRIEPIVPSSEEIADLAATLGDEHAIKFAEVARESHLRGNNAALSAASCAIELIAHP